MKWSLHARARTDGQTLTCVQSAAATAVLEVLTQHPESLEDLAQKAQVSTMTVRRAIRILQDVGVPIVFTRPTMMWSIDGDGPDLERVTLADCVDAGSATLADAWIAALRCARISGGGR